MSAQRNITRQTAWHLRRWQCGARSDLGSYRRFAGRARFILASETPRPHARRTMNNPRLRIGIDLGGTKIEGIALGADGVELARRRISTPRSYTATVDAITALVRQLEVETGGRAS